MSVFKLGKKPPQDDRYGRTLRFEKYSAALPPIPAEVDFISKVPSWPMYGYDTLGDCVAAAAGHMEQNWTTYAGKPITPTDRDVLKFYGFSGYTPNDPSSDVGWDLLSALNAWRQYGLGGHKIFAFVQLATGNWNQMRQACALFGNAYLGFSLPDYVVPDDGSDWTKINWAWQPGATPDENNGHCVPVMACSLPGAKFVSWGAQMRMSQKFYQNFNDEAFAVLTQDWIEADERSPSGCDLAQLKADLGQVTT